MTSVLIMTFSGTEPLTLEGEGKVTNGKLKRCGVLTSIAHVKSHIYLVASTISKRQEWLQNPDIPVTCRNIFLDEYNGEELAADNKRVHPA
jgi:hypothetical protein